MNEELKTTLIACESILRQAWKQKDWRKVEAVQKQLSKIIEED